jgi:hypothetical protein
MKLNSRKCCLLLLEPVTAQHIVLNGGYIYFEHSASDGFVPCIYNSLMDLNSSVPN